MFSDFLKKNKKMAWFLAIVRFFLGIVWFRHGFEKISNKSFDASVFLKDAIAKTSGTDPVVQDWWAFIAKYFFLPNVDILNYLVPIGEFFVGLGLMTGAFTRPALCFALIMNFSYLLSGSMNINPQMILWSWLLLSARENAGRVGADGWIFSSVKRRMAPAPAKPPAKPPV
ncbi:DoxX family protein [Ectobacillus funiculus]|uniref:DoxX family protein n=1 Tax=Ectobacillus funiculus TaxID=137993 RepID=UPI00397DE9B3